MIAKVRSSGFTLLELLLVIVIGAIAVSGVVMALPSSQNRQLTQEADRLAALLESARARSRATGEAVYFQAEGKKMGFTGAQTQSILPAHWMYPDTLAKPVQLILGPEPVIDAQRVVIEQSGLSKVVSSDGVRPFVTESP